MLCALLQNAPQVAQRLVGWLGLQVSKPCPIPNEIELHFETEGAIGAKRDDLRIVGKKGDGEDTPYFVWSMEIKVGASLHYSSRQLDDTEVLDEEIANKDVKAELVNQLQNYDDWLATRPAERVAGFVLGVQNLQEAIPSNLKCDWTCLTWTGIGEQLSICIRDANLPPHESFLARHVLGFIYENLWRESEMSQAQLNLNDVALIRAFAALADDCKEKVRRLVEPLAEVITRSGVGQGEVGTQKLFEGRKMCEATCDFGGEWYLTAAIGCDTDAKSDYLSVWLEGPSKHPQKAKFKAQINSMIPSLKKRNPAWSFPSQDSEKGWQDWIDVELTVSLEKFLGADDQRKALEIFVERAIEDLKDVGLIDAFKKTIAPKK